MVSRRSCDVTLPSPLADYLRQYVSSLDRHFGDRLVSVVLFGSRAREQARAESDADLLVVIRGLPRNRWQRYEGFKDRAREISGEFADMLALILATPEEALNVKPYYLGMLSGHEILFDREHFFASVLDRLRRRLAELGSRRYVDPDGYEYWDLKPDWRPGDVVKL
jgi:predicted nucleotidyltransferase